MPLLLLVAFARSSTLTVGASGDFPSVQGAVDAAMDGDEILLDVGTFTECVDLGGRDLIITGSGAAGTMLNGEGCSAAFRATAGATVKLSSLTITNTDGRALDLVEAVVTLQHVEVMGAGELSPTGGGSTVEGGALTISGCAFRSTTGRSGGATHVSGGAALQIADSSFQECAASGGGVRTCFLSFPLLVTLLQSRDGSGRPTNRSRTTIRMHVSLG